MEAGDILSFDDQRFELRGEGHKLKIIIVYHDGGLNTGRERWCAATLPLDYELDAQPQAVVVPLSKGGQRVAALECSVRVHTEVF